MQRNALLLHGTLAPVGFDPGYQPRFVNRIRWAPEPGGVALQNRDVEDARLVRVPP
jgi:hypothetical protein